MSNEFDIEENIEVEKFILEKMERSINILRINKVNIDINNKEFKDALYLTFENLIHHTNKDTNKCLFEILNEKDRLRILKFYLKLLRYLYKDILNNENDKNNSIEIFK